MFLKSLYISGFKSFAQPTTINFSEDLSAIVGPNGSGKSNISDAIRFVLGEQRTKQMRSQSMEDIIFSGTESQSARGLAEVKLVLADEENPDLVIERKYYRTGESDYLLNGKKVRLKDIYSRFADTGLGRNGYSIISQGGVENIIGASPKELKELVEEAVGIAGYKVRKNETVKRLNSIESNIERVLDVLTEMKKQLKPLKKQAKKAREYLKITNILRDIDLVSFYEKEIEYQDKLKELNKNLTASNFTLIDLDKQSELADSEFLRTKNRIATLREVIETLTDKITQTKDSISDYEKEITVIKNNLKNYELNISRINGEISSSHNNLNTLREKIENLRNRKDKTNSKLENLKKEFTDLSEKLSSEKTTKENLESRSLESELDQVNEKINSIKLNRIKLETEIEALKESEKTNQEKQDKQKLKLKNLSDQKKDLEIQLNTLKDNNIKFLEQFNTAQEEYSNLEENNKKLSTELTNIQNKIDYQKQVRDSYEGFNYSVRSVMSYSQKNKISGVYGPVGDLFTTDARYQTAIQVALGGSVQNIVVENSKIAQELIQYLKRENTGRVTFLPLDNIKVFNTTEVGTFKGMIDRAVELIEFKPKFKLVFEQLLGRSLVFLDYSSARNFRAINKRNILVTLEGECFYPSGAIVGGSLKKNFNQLLLPNQELKRLEQQKVSIVEKLKESETQSKKLNNLIESNSKRRNSLIKEEEQLKNKIDSLEQHIKILASEISTYSTDNNLVLKENSLKIINNDLKALEEHKHDLAKNLNLHQDKLSGLDSKITDLNSKLVEKRIEYNKVENELNSTNIRLMELTNSLDEENKNYINKIKEKDKLVSETKTNETRFKELSELNKTLNINLTKNEAKLETNKGELKELEKIQTDIESKIKSLNSTRIQEVEVKSKIEGQIDKTSFAKESLSSKIFDQYNENFNSVSEKIEQLINNKLDLTDYEINDYKQKLKKLGNINPNSIEDYHELKERYEELNSNYEDLVQAKADVENTISSLNQSMGKQFKEKFELLNKYFDKSFKTLFEGGKANLNLTNHEDLLESGIELYAQPPGKRLKHINLLSGGEKAMTSIALLFAFIELNPSPFIIIDEIDAALDESNINRFTNYLKKIQGQNQFIIITHRKSTLSECNDIHGVSMASDGISRLCSIKLSDYIGE